MSSFLRNKVGFSNNFKLYIFLTLILSAACLFFINNHSLISHDEAVYASRSRLILLKNNWFTPFEKPHHKTIGSYWLIAVSLKLFGINEISARLPSFISSIIANIYTFKIASLFTNKRTGYIAVIILLSTPIWFQYSHYASPDMLFVSLNLISIYLISNNTNQCQEGKQKSNSSHWLAAGIIFSFAFIVRSSMQLLPLISFAPYIYLVSKRYSFQNLKYLFLGLFLGSIPLIISILLAYNSYGQQAISELVSFTSQKAFNSGNNQILNGFIFYPRNLFLLSLPCGFVSIFGIKYILSKKSLETKSLLIGTPLLSTFLLMVSSSNHFHYCLIIIPWISILSSIAIERYLCNESIYSKTILKAIGISFFLIGSSFIIFEILSSINIVNLINQKFTTSILVFIYGIYYVIFGIHLNYKSKKAAFRINELMIILTIHAALYSILFSQGLIGNSNKEFKDFITKPHVQNIIKEENIIIADPYSNDKARFLLTFYIPSFTYLKEPINTIKTSKYLIISDRFIAKLGEEQRNKLRLIDEYQNFNLIFYDVKDRN